LEFAWFDSLAGGDQIGSTLTRSTVAVSKTIEGNAVTFYNASNSLFVKELAIQHRTSAIFENSQTFCGKWAAIYRLRETCGVRRET